MSSLDTGIKVALDITFGMANDFTIWVLPMSVRPLHFHIFNCFFPPNIVIIKKHTKNLNRNFKFIRESLALWISYARTKNSVFASFTLRPEHSENLVKQSRKQSYEDLLRRIQVILSAKSVTLTSANLNTLNVFIFRILHARISNPNLDSWLSNSYSFSIAHFKSCKRI